LPHAPTRQTPLSRSTALTSQFAISYEPFEYVGQRTVIGIRGTAESARSLADAHASRGGDSMLTTWAPSLIHPYEQEDAPSLLRQWTARYGRPSQPRLTDSCYIVQEFSTAE
jgi:hypothetical protein